MKKNTAFAILMLPTLALLASCNSGGARFPEAHLTELQTGAKLTGILKQTTRYFVDKECIEASTLKPTQIDKTRITLTYTNTPEYTGVDVKLAAILDNNQEYYLMEENAYNNRGHLFFNSIDYDNHLDDSYQALDQDNNEVPYGSNVSLNPFALLKMHDFHALSGEAEEYSLDKIKAALVFANLAYYNTEVPLNINIKENKFVFADDGLKSVHFVTSDYKDIETIGLNNVYTLSTFELDMDVIEKGTTDAKSEIQPEPEKPENNDLGVAIENLAAATSYRVNRHYQTDESPREETIDVYFDGKNEAIYMAPYDLSEGSRPTAPTTSDALLVDSKKDNDFMLNAYMYSALENNPSEFAYQDTGLLNNINNQFDFGFALLPLANVSKNVFNKNSDGSFSPIVSNIAYMPGDCFVPFLCTTNEIAGGYVEDFKIYLTEDKQMIDHIELVTQMATIHANITVTYDQINTCTIPFNALNRIVEK